MGRLATLSLSLIFLAVLVLDPEPQANAQGQLSPEMQQKIDKVATDALAKSGVPSASIAVVKDGQIAYLHAYGNAKLDPATAAKPSLQHWIDQQAVHGRSHPSSAGAGQTLTR